MRLYQQYETTHVQRYGVMLRLHRRHQYLDKIFRNFRSLSKGREAFFLAIQCDRISGDVTKALKRELRHTPANWTVDVFETPVALVDRRENYMTALQVHYEFLLDMADNKLDAASLWDDDFWLTARGLWELKGHMDILEADRIECRSYFLWDDLTVANEGFPAHWQALLFRYYRGDKFPENYIVHCPHRAAQGTQIRMQARLRNAGYMDSSDRRITWEAYKRAGKVDAHTISLVNEPELVSIERRKL